MQLSENFFKNRKINSLVENKTSYVVDNAAMHIFETHEQAERVLLKFDNPVLASMLEGKKVMHLKNENPFDFFPGESIILPSNELMCIDFPEADLNNPTRCLAMCIAEEKIKEILNVMNETMPKDDRSEWTLIDYNFHFNNDKGIYYIIQRLIYLFTENHPSKEIFVNNMIKELIIRILQTNRRKLYEDKHVSTDSRLYYITKYIQNNIHQNLTVEELSKKACMSESSLYRSFKNELGLTPVEFINNERIKLAAKLLQDPKRKVKEVFTECGFESRSYFNRVFRKVKKVSPTQYQQTYFTY
ncbi:AraC family transcriptional regulator [Abyssalbus ytuae]|uniref:AraC family transcriptional regulator n=1 Tax=Abyssalbus ytuae TaxID=2926907 RepID=A0A9E6ZI43_9FLAO|nr:AraC family transcriptional regulator [Abyssalbus ytuae]UOB15917.1 AraC family transcriptional regulator [Abyssalbus ytuae]